MKMDSNLTSLKKMRMYILEEAEKHELHEEKRQGKIGF